MGEGGRRPDEGSALLDSINSGHALMHIAAIRAIKPVASPYRLCYRDAAAGRGSVPYPEFHAWGRSKFKCLGCVP